MNAVLKQQNKARSAIVWTPKGHVSFADQPSPLVSGAMLRLPKGHTSSAPETPTDAQANRLLPNQAKRGMPAHPPIAVAAKPAVPKGHLTSAAQQPHADGSAIGPVPKGQTTNADHLHPNDGEEVNDLMPKGPICAASPPSIPTLRELHRKRQDFHRAEKSLTLQIKAVCRRLCAGDKGGADKLYTAVQKGADDAYAIMARDWVEPFMHARGHLESSRKLVEKNMAKLAKTLPIVAWVEEIHGFGIASLAALIGEAGDLSNYPTHSHLWKRLGLAVIDGGRQRNVSGVDALKHGYCASRRSVVWNIGQCVFKAQSQRVDKETGEITAEAGHYRQVYDARKAYEADRVESKAHAHNRAMRYMEKRLIRDLWKAWRQVPQT